MKISAKSFTPLTLSAAAWLSLGAPTLRAQEPFSRGNFDRQQMRQRMSEMLRQKLEIKDDAEWKAISNRVQKVVEARQSLGGGMMEPGGGPPPQGSQGGRPEDNQGGPGSGPPPGEPGIGGPGGPGGFNRKPNPELDALRKAVEGKASAAELKEKLAALKASRQQKQAALEKAQDELRQVLSLRQEAIAATLGLL